MIFSEIAEPSLLVEMETGRIIAANPASCAMLGYSREEMGEITPADLHPHELARLDAFFAHVRREGSWADDNMSCRTRDGLLVPAEIRAFLIEVGGQPHVLTLLRDLRDRRLADIGQSVQRLVHDLRNVLVTTQLLSDRLRDHPDAAVQSSAAVIARSVARALDLCRETIAVGRAVEKAPRRSRFFLGDVVAEVVATTLAEGLARLEFDFESDV
ncbi:MAG: histidine kinase, partial [Alphaproteobacteria bacterium HGW-Alphaproteobacteria-2]